MRGLRPRDHAPRTLLRVGAALEESALGVLARHDPLHLHMASRVGADAQYKLLAISSSGALRSVWVAGLTELLHGGSEPLRATHDEVHE